MRILLAEEDLAARKSFGEAFQRIHIPTVLDFVSNGERLLEYLSISKLEAPHILFLKAGLPPRSTLEYLTLIRQEQHLGSMTLVVYAESLPEEQQEEIFAGGANVYISQYQDQERLNRVLQEVIHLNWQYMNSRMNLDHFIMSV